MRKSRLLICLLLFSSLVLSGCNDLIEIDEMIYPLIIGVDIGVENKVRMTLQYPTYKGVTGGAIGGGGEGGGGGGEISKTGELEGTVITTIEASTLLEGVNLLNIAVSRRISLTHTKMLVFSEEFARKGVGEYLAPMMRYRETRRIMHVVVCRGKAEDFIKTNKSTIGASATKSMELMVTQSENSGLFSKETFIDFYHDILSPSQNAITAYAGVNDFNNLSQDEPPDNPPLNEYYNFVPGEVPRKGAAQREFLGTAVFKTDKMVGYLNAHETRYLMMITGKLKRALVSLEDVNKPGYAIVVDKRIGRKPVIKGYFEDGIPVINIKLNMEGDLGAIQSRINYDSMERIEELNRMIEERIKKGVERTIKKVQKEFKSDIFDFGYKFAGYFDTIQEWEEYDWHKHFPEAKINVEVEFNVRRTGVMYGSSPILDSDYEE